jgi:hypothetical protein
MDFAAVERSVAIALAGAASAVGTASLIRILTGGRRTDPRDETLRRTDILWTAVPVLLLLALLGGVLLHTANG